MVPRHFYRREPAAADAAPAEPELVSQETDAAPEGPSPYLRPTDPARPPSGSPRPAPAARGVARAALASKERLASTDYGYVVGELKRIFATAALIVVLLVVVALIKR